MRHLPACLDALSQQSYREFEVVLVDNGSTDESVQAVQEKWPEVRVISLDENKGFPAAVNAGITSSDSEFVVLLNNDTRPSAEWLEQLVRSMDQHPEFSYASSKLVRIREPHVIDSVGHRYSLWRGAAANIGDGEPADRYHSPAWVFGASAAASIYRRSLFDDVGMFDEDFFLTHEDVELDFRANVAGHRCMFVPDAVVGHERGGSFDVSPAIHLLGVRNRIWAAGANLPGPLLLYWLVAELVRTAWVLPIRRYGSGRSGSVRVGWSEISVGQFLRTVLNAMRVLPKKRSENKSVRRLGSIRMLRVLRTTRIPRPIGSSSMSNAG